MTEINNFYLAHPFEARKIVRPWELLVEKFFKINLINPIYDLHKKETEEIDKGKKTRYEDVDHIKLVNKELNNIKDDNTQGIFLIQPGDFFSIGAYHEMVYCHNLGKPVYSLILNGHHEHPWVKFHSTKIFTNCDAINNFLLDNFELKDGFTKEEILELLSSASILFTK